MRIGRLNLICILGLIAVVRTAPIAAPDWEDLVSEILQIVEGGTSPSGALSGPPSSPSSSATAPGNAGTGSNGASTSGTGTGGTGTSGAGTSGAGTSGAGTSGAGTSGAGTSGTGNGGTGNGGTGNGGTGNGGTGNGGTGNGGTGNGGTGNGGTGKTGNGGTGNGGTGNGGTGNGGAGTSGTPSGGTGTSGTGNGGTGSSGAAPGYPVPSGAAPGGSGANSAAPGGLAPTGARQGGSGPGGSAPTGAPAAASGSGGNGAGAKGVGAWPSGNDAQNIQDLGCSWTYVWGPVPTFENPLPSNVEFVPMMSTKEQASDSSNIDQIKASASSYTAILGPNEPDVNDYSVDDVVALWPSLVSTGLKIGSPAPSKTSLTQGDWFFDFMTQVQQQNLKVDFICLHHYADSSDVQSGVQTFQAYIESIYQMYQLPIWITEYAMVNFDGSSSGTGNTPDHATEAQYTTAATQMLQTLSYVERYAWFALTGASNQPDTGLYSDDGSSITEMGTAYQQV